MIAATNQLTTVGLTLAILCPLMSGIAAAALVITAAVANRRRNGRPPQN